MVWTGIFSSASAARMIEQFRRRLRAVGFVHRNFGDEIRRALGLGDVPVNFPGVLHRQQKLAGDALDFRAR